MLSKPTLFLILAPLTKAAQDVVELDAVKVEGRGSLLVGEALSASQGVIGQIDLQTRPMLRTGEVLEAVPGMIVTQHSGTGKANQYFLRGFNLDHGTDFATWIDGMPVNMVSHGQGYTDLNFIIPELVDNISYLKGSCYSEVGDLSSAGSASIQTMRELENDMISVDYGEDGYLRAFGATSQSVGEDGTLLFGAENVVNNGPWDIDENLNKINGLVTYSATPTKDLEYGVTLMAYNSSWDSADQIPDRAVEQGLITPFGSIDDTVGGSSSRYSLSGHLTKNGVEQTTKLSAYTIYYDMAIWSNFTYFLDNPVGGDQFQQSDRRMIYGAELAHLFGYHMQQTFGLQTRYDAVDKVGLYNTQARQILSANREDSGGIEDKHYQIIQPRSLRLNVTKLF
ncbi:TonB-dependent receptor plug domain protein [Verrucomicrobiia bacterium DG1235]|nr:TonB-dependent receptor plug domain protein [Verrucomicrobiae bacterium DG1235]